MDILREFGPLGLSLVIIFQLVMNMRGQRKIATNHLHGLPEMLETLKRMESNQDRHYDAMLRALGDIRENQAYIKARINGKS